MKQVSMINLLKSLSGVMDLVSNSVVSHHKKVAYIAYKIAKEMKINSNQLKNLVMASLIHDIGVFYLNIDLDKKSFDERENMHALVGYYLLNENNTLNKISNIIRDHHHDWEKIQSDDISVATNILHVADQIAFLTEEYDMYNDNNKICKIVSKESGKDYCPDALLAFNKLAAQEYFCLDIESPTAIERKLDKIMKIFAENITGASLLDISKIISYIVDFRSPFTTTHSIGIAKVAKELIKLMKYSLEDQLTMEIAGYLHDVGKLIVPPRILNKNGPLNKAEWKKMRTHTYYTYQVLEPINELPHLKEWAGFHHETLDGQGYPFHLKGEKLSPGARVMAVADIFTAVTEDRPYRKGMNKSQVIKVLNDLAENNQLDKDIVNLLLDNYHSINSIREGIQVKAQAHFLNFRNKIDRKVELYR